MNIRLKAPMELTSASHNHEPISSGDQSMAKPYVGPATTATAKADTAIWMPLPLRKSMRAQ